MASFREVGEGLKDRFDGAARVKINTKKKKVTVCSQSICIIRLGTINIVSVI